MREPIEEKPEGAPEWMVSYADMITIIMSFFVIMFALSSKKDGDAQRATAASFEYRFSPSWRPFGTVGPGLAPRGPRGKHKGQGRQYGQAPGGDLDQPEAASDPARRFRVQGRGDHLDMGGMVFFDDASAELGSEQLARLREIVVDIAGKPQRIEVLGHTSKRPLPPDSPYKDHWDLAYARCRQAMEQLVALGIEPSRIRIAVAGSSEPMYSGDSPELLKRNSRVDVYLLNALADQSDEEKSPDSRPAPGADGTKGEKPGA